MNDWIKLLNFKGDKEYGQIDIKIFLTLYGPQFMRALLNFELIELNLILQKM